MHASTLACGATLVTMAAVAVALIRAATGMYMITNTLAAMVDNRQGTLALVPCTLGTFGACRTLKWLVCGTCVCGQQEAVGVIVSLLEE